MPGVCLGCAWRVPGAPGMCLGCAWRVPGVCLAIRIRHKPSTPRAHPKRAPGIRQAHQAHPRHASSTREAHPKHTPGAPQARARHTPGTCQARQAHARHTPGTPQGHARHTPSTRGHTRRTPGTSRHTPSIPRKDNQQGLPGNIVRKDSQHGWSIFVLLPKQEKPIATLSLSHPVIRIWMPLDVAQDFDHSKASIQRDKSQTCLDT